LGNNCISIKKKNWRQEEEKKVIKGSDLERKLYLQLVSVFWRSLKYNNPCSYITSSWLYFILLMTHFKGERNKVKILRKQGYKLRMARSRRPSHSAVGGKTCWDPLVGLAPEVLMVQQEDQGEDWASMFLLKW
jgi:hypothetical protein